MSGDRVLARCLSLSFWAFAVLMIAFGLSAWPVLDDFGLSNDLHSTMTVWGMVKHWYLTWSGRVLSTAVVAGLFSLPIASLPLISALNGLTFALTAWVSSELVFENNKNRLVFGSILFLALSWSELPLMSQCVFWASGGIVYAGCLFVGVVWLVWLLQPPNAFRQPLWIFLSFCAGLTHELLFLSLLSFGSWQFLTAKLSQKDRHRVLVGLILLAVGGAILLLAPGNYSRNIQTHTVSLRDKLSYLKINLFHLMSTYWEMFFRRTLGYSTILGLLSSVLFRNMSGARSKESLRTGMGLLLSIFPPAGLIFFMHSVGTTTERMWYFPIFLLVVGVFFIARGLVDWVWDQDLLTPKGKYYLGRLVALATLTVALIHVGQLAKDLRTTRRYRIEVQALLRNLERLRGTHEAVLVSPIVLEKPRRLSALGLSEDPGFYVNGQIAAFFCLPSIRLK